MSEKTVSSTSNSLADEKSVYPVPDWAVRPPRGFHLDVLKNDQLIQKLMIDEKKAYYFGRNPKQVDIAVDHASCSRVHALLLYHGKLKRFGIVDLGSSHGTFIGNVRITPLQCVFVEEGATFHLGASTRRYVIREKVEMKSGGAGDDEDEEKEKIPVDQELENLTEYNTAVNRRVPHILISLEECRRKKRKRGNVAFIEEEEVINPEDVDPTIGRFRNLVTTAYISTNSGKRLAKDENVTAPKKIIRAERNMARYAEPMSSSLGGIALNSAPDLDLYMEGLKAKSAVHVYGPSSGPAAGLDSDEPHKKKYAKEAWPGRKPGAL